MSATLAEPTSPLERLPHEWEAVLGAWGEPRYRALQIFKWIHQRGVLDPAKMTDLPKGLRAKLEAERLAPELALDLAHPSEDGTQKLLFKLGDGRAIESVLIPQGAGGDDDPIGGEEPEDDASRPVTQCISSQVGCAMGCVFCASGMAGLKRNLSAAEIVLQVLHGRGHVAEGQRLCNVVLMGMGELLHNYDCVARALTLLFHPDGMGLSTRRVTLSTSGLVSEMDRLGRDFGGKVQLAVSIHVPDDERCSEIGRAHV